MSWRENALATGALAEQGYWDEDNSVLYRDSLAAAIRDVFLREPVRASDEEVLERQAHFRKVALSKNQLVDAILPGFRENTELNEEESILLKKNPREHGELEERSKAVTDITTLLWGTMCKTGREGSVQKLLVNQKLLLVESKIGREGDAGSLKAATDDHDLIIDWYVRPRGDQLVRVSGGVRDDCAMVGLTFEGITARMRQELGGSVTTAVTNLLQVASPNFAALTSASEKETKAIAAVSPRS